MYDDESDTLETAQQRKLEYHIQQARAEGAARVLDIGCGWGALQKKLVREHGVKLAVGLTLSENQAQWIRSMGLPGVEVRVESWSDLYRPRRMTRSFRLGLSNILRVHRAARSE
jgi:cyclopropane-fatty-acyl-phospholipid synthase